MDLGKVNIGDTMFPAKMNPNSKFKPASQVSLVFNKVLEKLEDKNKAINTKLNSIRKNYKDLNSKIESSQN